MEVDWIGCMIVLMQVIIVLLLIWRIGGMIALMQVIISLLLIWRG